MKPYVALGITLLLGVAVLLNGLSIFGVIREMAENRKESLSFSAPSRIPFEIGEDESLEYRLSHIKQGFVDEVTVYEDTPLPSGYSFEVVPVGGKGSYPLSLSGGYTTTTNVSGQVTSTEGLGTFTLPARGQYELVIDGPAAEPRYFRLSPVLDASPFAIFSKVFLCGLLMLGFFVAALMTLLLFVFRRRSPQAHSSHPNPNASEGSSL